MTAHLAPTVIAAHHSSKTFTVSTLRCCFLLGGQFILANKTHGSSRQILLSLNVCKRLQCSGLALCRGISGPKSSGDLVHLLAREGHGEIQLFERLQIDHLQHLQHLPLDGPRIPQTSGPAEKLQLLPGDFAHKRVLPDPLNYEEKNKYCVRILKLATTSYTIVLHSHCRARNLLGNPCTTATISLQERVMTTVNSVSVCAYCIQVSDTLK